MKMKFLAVLGCTLLLVSCGGRRTATAPAYRAFPLPDVPAMISDMQERQEYIAAHYWDGFFEGEWPTDSAHVLGVGDAELEQNISAFIMFLEALPMDRALFPQLFDYLDEQSEEYECQGDFAMTETFLKAHGVSAEPVLKWLRENGAGCDCEVLLNVEELFE